MLWTGGTYLCSGGIFSHAMDTDRGQIDGNQPGIPGSMMGIDRVCPHHLIGVDWAQDHGENDAIVKCYMCAMCIHDW